MFESFRNDAINFILMIWLVLEAELITVGAIIKLSTDICFL